MNKSPIKLDWSESWRPILLLLALLQGFALISNERDRINELRKINERNARDGERHSEDHSHSYDFASDPQKGNRMPLIKLRDYGGQVVQVPSTVAGDTSIILFVGSCTSCTKEFITTWSQLAKPGVKIYAVAESDAAALSRFQKYNPLPVTFLIDPKDTALIAKYNIGFRPRAYVIGDDRKLLFIQRQSDSTEHALKRVAGLVKSNYPFQALPTSFKDNETQAN